MSVNEDRAQKTYRSILKHEIITGLIEVRRPTLGLFLSSLSAGLDIGFSLLLMATMMTLFGENWESAGARILTANMYSLGFILVIIGRSELFTEHTALAVLPLLDGRSSLKELSRVWIVVYSGNLIGASVFACMIQWVAPSLGAVDPSVFESIAKEMMHHPWWVILVSASLAGWLMGELAWLIGASRDTISQVFFVWLVTTAIGLIGLHHVVVGAAEVVAAFLSSDSVRGYDVFRLLLWTTIGNALGGVFFVSVIKYGHAVHSMPDEEQDAIAEEVARETETDTR